LQRQRVDQILGKTVGKIFVGALAQIRERQHADNRRPILGRKVADRCFGRGFGHEAAGISARGLPVPDLDRLVDVLEPVGAGVGQRHAEALAGLMTGLARNRHAAGSGN
jgi:hypothetical protein